MPKRWPAPRNSTLWRPCTSSLPPPRACCGRPPGSPMPTSAHRSLPPGRSRGHVLTHPARNADGGRRLLGGARTGVGTSEYPSRPARDGRIEAGAGRSAAELLAELRCSAAEFEAEFRRMPPEARHRTVRRTRGRERPAARAADARPCEMLVHHVDPDAGRTPAHRPADFVEPMLGRVVAALGAREGAPAVVLHATDTGASCGQGGGAAAAVRGSRRSRPAWLLERSGGARCSGAAGRALPPLKSSARTRPVPAVESLGGRSARSVDPSHFCAVRVRLEAPGRCGSLTTHQHMWGYRRG
ncbi:maleylpyruvate isomerase N-terminal domain-containing protein [Kitasatospora griseola]|uniref:maleylpyruvate isomerase N-terminal domain-containing protein n=1 Tax=Kitasatospora griseola TaxID=2064 RepID=UPI0036D8D1E3